MNNMLKQLLAMTMGALLVVVAFFVYDAYGQEDPAAAEYSVAPTGVTPQVVDDVDGFPSPISFQYQGQLLNAGTGTPVTNQVLPMTFRLYNAQVSDISTALWGEQLSVQVTDGIFTVLLGAQAANPIPTSLFEGQNLYLGVAVGANQNDEATPRQPLTTVPFAVNAQLFDGAPPSDFVAAKRGPIAYGIVNESCSREKGYRFSSGPGPSSDPNACYITLKDANDNNIDYNLNEFVTQVTVVENSSCPGASMATTGSGNGQLIVDIYNSSGNERGSCKFHFITFQP